MTRTERAYLAGLIDGEGCISMFWNNSNDGLNGSTMARVHICMCDEPLIEWIKERVGSGTIYVRPHEPEKGWRPISTIVWTGRSAVPMLRQVLPYLRLKKRQARIFLAWVALSNRTRKFHGRKGGSPYPKWVLAKRDAWLLEMRSLNQRGVPPISDDAIAS